eukprot:7104677-Prorocentrum_lima.AAC.1
MELTLGDVSMPIAVVRLLQFGMQGCLAPLWPDVGPAFEEAENADHVSSDFVATMSPAICCERRHEQYGHLAQAQ